MSDGAWRYVVVEAGGSIILSIILSNDARVSVDDVYAGAFDVPGDPQEPWPVVPSK